MDRETNVCVETGHDRMQRVVKWLVIGETSTAHPPNLAHREQAARTRTLAKRFSFHNVVTASPLKCT